MELAPFGIVGLETAFPLLYTYFVEKGIITLEQLLGFFTNKPSEAFNLPFGAIEKGTVADVVLLDLHEEKEIDVNEFASKGKNTPFGGWKCKGWPVLTMFEGKVVWQKENVKA